MVSTRNQRLLVELEEPAFRRRPASSRSTGEAGSIAGRGLRPKGLCPHTPARRLRGDHG